MGRNPPPQTPNSTLRIVDRRAHGVYDTRVPEIVAAVNNYLA
jgi:hypothetical protein